MAAADHDMHVRLEWDTEADAGYIAFVDIADGEAVHQWVVANPVAGLGDVVLDFDASGHLLGLEILGSGQLHPAMTAVDGEVST